MIQTSHVLVGAGAGAREQIFGVSAEQTQLQPFLKIQPPVATDQAPPVLSFRRKRHVELPWKDILGSSATEGVTSIAAIREYFEGAWGLGEIDAGNLPAVAGGDHPRIVELQSAGRDAAGKPVPRKMHRGIVAGAPGEDATVESGLAVQHGISGRWYLMVPSDGATLSAADLATPAAYHAMWKDKVDGVELVFESADAAKAGVTQFSEIDLRPGVIHRAFNELLIQKNFAEDVEAGAKTTTKNAVDKITSTTLDLDDLQRLQAKSFRLQMQAFEARRRLDRLVTQAADLGYYLFLKPTTFNFPGGKPTEVKAGEIYRQFTRTATWVTTHTRSITQSSGWWIFKSNRTVKQQYVARHTQEVSDYRIVDTSRDPLVDGVTTRRADGQTVFVFEQGPTGFVTADGTLLREVMAQCDRNEAFRKSCVVMLPVYEESLTGERALLKYAVFERPLPGISPSAMPQFSLLESLSYRTAWRESQLGELVSTINLAPGEERTVVLTRSFERESTVTRSSTSVFDISRTESSDLATEMENQARQESEHSSNMSFSASAKASYGFVSGEASASGGSNASLKSFSQAIGKVAKKAAQAINQQSREEVSTSSSARTTVSNRDETTATLRNINQGRTLNLMFHRLNNRYQGGIYLDDLQFEIIPSTEIIGGSGVHESLRFTLDELPQLLDQFRQTRLPFEIADPEPGKAGFLERVVETLQQLLLDEYAKGDDATSGAPRAERAQALAQPPQPGRSVARLSLGAAPPAMRRRALQTTASAATDTAFDSFVEQLRGATIDRETAIHQDDLILASGGLYLDAVVGAYPGTEPYSEEMRAQEIRMRDAEVRKSLAEAEYNLALAASLGGGAAALAQPDNGIVSLRRDAPKKSLRVQLRMPPAPGHWDLLLDGERKGTTLADAADGAQLVFRWPQPQGWLQEQELERRIQLEQRATRDRLGYRGV